MEESSNLDLKWRFYGSWKFNSMEKEKHSLPGRFPETEWAETGSFPNQQVLYFQRNFGFIFLLEKVMSH